MEKPSSKWVYAASILSWQSHKPKTEVKILSEIFCRIVYSSRFVGLTPLQINNSNASVQFSFNLYSWPAFFSGMYQIFYASSALFVIYKLLTGQAKLHRAIGIETDERYEPLIPIKYVSLLFI